ncbi:MAG: POTRA domain-containing protein [Bacteroidales bacterium]
MFKQLFLLFLVSCFSFLHAEETVPGAAVRGDTLYIVGKIDFQGNKYTRDKIISRELMFHSGDTLSYAELRYLIEETRENMLNTSLFNFVTVDTVYTSGQFSKADITYKFVERWYLWPFPVIKMADRNFNTWLKSGDPGRMTYGFYLQKDNFRGKREKLVASYVTGYEQSFGFTYEVPYLTKQQNIGLIINILYEKNHTVPYDSYNNKLQEVKDKDFFLQTSLTTSLRLSYRKGIHYYHYLSLTHNRYDFADTLLKLNPKYSFREDYHPEFISLSYRVKADFRDFQPFPLTGFYSDIEITKNGLDLLGNTHPNQLVIKSSLKKYWKLEDRFHYAVSVTGKMTLQEDQPFFLMKGLGYENDFVRGYEYYVVDGEDYLLMRNDLKWTVLKTRVGQVGFVPESVGRIHYTVYLSAFTDAAYSRASRYDNLNFLANRWLLGTGAGLNIVTYYDKVFRFEVSHNHKGETGFFMHFVAPI